MARSIWKGTLGFGLVSIGVELFNAEASQGLELSMLDARDHAPIGYRKYNKQTGDALDDAGTVKGYEVAKGQYVILSPADLVAANPKSTGMIDILGFVHASDIDMAFLDKPYIVGPLKGSEKAYALFVQALDATARVGIAQVVIRTRQHVAAIYPYQGAVMVQLMRYDAELRKPSDFGIDAEAAIRTPIRPQELAMAERLVESMTMEWDPSVYRDEYRDDLLRLIEARVAAPNGTGTVTSARAAGPTPRVLDLTAALKKSLEAQSGGGRRSAAAERATGARRGTHRAAHAEKQVASRAKGQTKAATKRRPARKSA